MIKKHTRLVLSLAISFIILVVLFRNTSFAEVLNLIEKADFRIILIAFVISIFNGVFISSLRWKLILDKMDCDISWKESLFVKVASEPIISIIPFKAGEISRVLYLKRMKNMPYEKACFSIFIEYLLNIFMLLFLVFLGGVFWLCQSKIFTLRGDISLFLCCSEMRKIMPRNKWIGNLGKCFKDYFKGCRVFLGRKILCCSFLFGFFELVCVYLISKAINVDIPFFSILVYVPLIIVVSSIPVTFLGLGVRETTVVLLFLKYASSEKLLALGILYSFAEHILPLFIGLSLTSLFVNRIISSRK